MPCPLCYHQGTEIFQANGIPVLDCTRCHHRYAGYEVQANHIEQQYGDGYFLDGGDGYPDYLAEGDLLRSHGKRYAQLLRHHTEPGDLLEIGTAGGFLLESLCADGWRGVGVEPNARMVQHAREELGLDVLQGTIEDESLDAEFLSRSKDGRFDLITMLQVLPHLVDPKATMGRVADLTREGGLWLIESWDRNSRAARMAGKRWHEYSPPGVLHWFSHGSLLHLASEFGLEEVAHGHPKKRISARHARSLMLEKIGDSRLGRMAVGISRILPDRTAMPYPARDLFWTLLRKRV